MRTTAIFVEILITGIQASIWITLLILTIFGWSWVPNFANQLKDFIVIIAIPLLAFFYTLGLVFDPVWIGLEYLVKPTKWFLTNTWVDDNMKKYSESVPIETYKAAETLGFLHQRMNNRVTIARTTFYNSLLTYPAAILFLVSIDIRFDWRLYTAFGFGFVLLVLSFIAYAFVQGLLKLKTIEIQNYSKRIEKELSKEKSSKSRDINYIFE